MKIKCLEDVHRGISLKKGKIYEARQGQRGWFSVVDESGEAYVYPPHLFEVVEDELSKYNSIHEDEREIQLIRQSTNYQYILSVWESYFNDIMNLFAPNDSGWHGLAANYHDKIGWYEKKPWKIPYAKDALKQFKTLEGNDLKLEASEIVLREICDFLEVAHEKREGVWISF